MENVISALDEYFCAHYSDYVRLSALKGYVMPDVLFVGADGNVQRRDPSCMRLNRQQDAAALLAELKEELCDTDFTFSFSFRSLRDKICDPFRKYTFKKVLPKVLARCGETAESAGEKLEIEPRFWKAIVRGRLYPEMNTVLALALVCRMQAADVQKLLNVCGFTLSDGIVRDVVVRYLLEQQVFSAPLRDACLREYRITNLPIKAEV